MNETDKKKIILKVASLIKDKYVFPDLATKLSETLVRNCELRRYQELGNLEDLVNALNEDMSHLTNDKHLSIRIETQMIMEMNSAAQGDDSAFQDMVRSNNYGFKESKMLENDIGYLNLDGFVNIENFPEAVTIAEQTMDLFKDAKAIIFDLRENTGGHPNMIQFLTSYLFEGEPIHLNSFYWRETNSETETWTLSDIKGTRLPNTKVFALTSKTTFSAAEEFTYNLKNLKRATIIGEVTGGGAHPGEVQIINDDLAMFVPSGRAINPITKTNWEGVGVQPDIEVAADEALDVAVKLVLDAAS